MKKYLFAICLSISCYAQAQVLVHVTKAHLDSLYNKYPVVPFTHAGFTNCYRWDTPYFQSIADVKQHQAMVVHGVYTKQMAHTADSLNYARKGVMQAWRHLPDMPNEDEVYSKANIGRTGNQKMDKGHFSAWELNAYNIDAALLSDTYTFNCAFELAIQNVGTELGVEYFQRFLVGTVKGRSRPAGLPFYDQVEYWKGAWGTQGSFSDGHTTDNYPAVYWNLLKYGDHLDAYWFPNNNQGAGQNNYGNHHIPYSSTEPTNLGLVQRLGWDPLTIFNPSSGHAQ